MAQIPSSPLGTLANKRLLLAVTGSIAAYKAPGLLRLLQKAGASVDVVLSQAARHFVGEATFAGLGARVYGDMWSTPGELHVELGGSVHGLVVAPATADTVARLAQGRSDDLLGATVLCSTAPLFLVPALHPSMWSSPVTQENVARLKKRGARFIGPAHGEVASGAVGEGRFEDPERIVQELEIAFSTTGLLRGRHVVVTAGPTKERLDPVRALTNDSSGKMGFALAEQAARQGARVTLIAGPVALPTPAGVTRIDVESALEMSVALDRALGDDLAEADVLIMAAAVADYRPRMTADEKLKRGPDAHQLELVPNPDILATIGKRRSRQSPVLVGFALETAPADALVALGRRKLIDKRVDLIVANSAQESLGRDENTVLLVSAQDCRKLGPLPKPVVATYVLEWIADRLDTAPTSGEFSA